MIKYFFCYFSKKKKIVVTQINQHREKERDLLWFFLLCELLIATHGGENGGSGFGSICIRSDHRLSFRARCCDL